jgi:hypothetical protein
MPRSAVVMESSYTLSSVAFSRRVAAPVLLAAMVAAAATIVSTAQPRFYPDDPIFTDDDMRLDASRVGKVADSNGYDFVVNTIVKPGDKQSIRAMNVNTVDEVPDSSWFVNRIGRLAMSRAQIVRGPDRVESISLDGWTVSGGKSAGVQAGFRMTDPTGHMYQIEFDPISNPEMATGAEIVGTAFYHAFGYHTADVYLVEVDPARLVMSPSAKIFDPLIGERRLLRRLDIDNVFRRSARQPNGKYRALASRFVDGSDLGNFRYYGTRPDDPNDIVPHEHRRELRGARVFGAWLNHDDSRGVNSLDFLTTEGSRKYVKHYMFDFGSIMGSGTAFAQRHRAGNEYIFEAKPGWLTLATLGLYTRPWLHIDYPAMPASVGRFESKAFDPVRWKPEYPNPAFALMRPDDAFWAARIVAKFSDADIRAVVEKARYTDPKAVDYLTATLIERRDKALKTWLTGVNPLVDFALSDSGQLSFENAAVQARLASPATSYRIGWAQFDNMTNKAQPADNEAVVTEGRAAGPPSVLAGVPVGGFVQVQISTTHPKFPAWATPVTVHFRRSVNGWTIVGVSR